MTGISRSASGATAVRSIGHGIALLLLSLLFVGAGINHFVNPGFYVSIMPPWLPWHLPLVHISGVGEIIGGLGILVSQLRRVAGWGLLALLVAVYPANIHMALHPELFDAERWLIYLRLPLQFVFAAWVYWTTIWRPLEGLPGKTESRKDAKPQR